jgi:hypothetical protein
MRLIIWYSSVISIGELNKRSRHTAGGGGELKNADTGSGDVKGNDHLDADFKIMLKWL